MTSVMKIPATKSLMNKFLDEKYFPLKINFL